MKGDVENGPGISGGTLKLTEKILPADMDKAPKPGINSEVQSVSPTGSEDGGLHGILTDFHSDVQGDTSGSDNDALCVTQTGPDSGKSKVVMQQVDGSYKTPEVIKLTPAMYKKAQGKIRTTQYMVNMYEYCPQLSLK
jgi:hypothetical protein